MMSDRFPQYTTDYISGVMSLRKPQTESLKVLEEIVNSVSLRKGLNLRGALGAVRAMHSTCTDFEREFMSLTFALASGNQQIIFQSQLGFLSDDGILILP